jgi:DNA repair exonuclease SbcCD ATPase subunit
MDELKSPNPLLLLLNEVDILLAQMRLLELCVHQAQAKVNYERERARQKYEVELANVHHAIGAHQPVQTDSDASAEATAAKLLANMRTIEDELNQSRSQYQSQIETLQYELAVRERVLTQRREAVSAVELALHRQLQVLREDLARLRAENASLKETTTEAEEPGRQAARDHQSPVMQNDNAALRAALSIAQGLQQNTEAKLDQLRVQLAQAQLIAESRAAEIGNFKEQLAALNQRRAPALSVNVPLETQRHALAQDHEFSRRETEQSLREEIARLVHEAEEKNRILRNRNDELVTVKSTMDALQERLSAAETTTAGEESAAQAELERMRSEFQAQLAFLQAELSQKDWALQEREATSQSLEQNYRHEIDALRQRLEEEKSGNVSATEEFTMGEMQLDPAPDARRKSQVHEHHAESLAHRRRWHTDFAWKRRWKASETK